MLINIPYAVFLSLLSDVFRIGMLELSSVMAYFTYGHIHTVVISFSKSRSGILSYVQGLTFTKEGSIILYCTENEKFVLHIKCFLFTVEIIS